MLFFVYWAAGKLLVAYKFDKVCFGGSRFGKERRAHVFSAQMMK